MIERMIQLKRLLGDRIRARAWSLRGAAMSAKVNVGKRCRIDFPKGVSLATRVTLESDVWLKLVSHEAKLSIGEFSFIGRGCEMDVADQMVIGSHVLVAPRVFITDHSHNISSGTRIGDQGCSHSPIVIGNDVWIGTAAVILPGVCIGEGSVIGAGAIVRCDVPPGEIWAGVPAKKIRDR